MGKEYVPIFLDWLETTQDLNKEEKGNLIDAVVAYASGLDYESMLTGNEKIAFRFLKGQIDRNTALSETRAKARAGKAEQTASNDNKPEQNETNDNKPKQNESNSAIENKKQKTKIENKKQNQNESAAAFDVFWMVYPRHTNKQAALKAWLALKPDEALQQTILAAIEKQKQSPQWTRDGGQYIPHPATWLHGRRWEDEMPQVGSPPTKTVSAQQYEQRNYTENELLSVSDDLLSEARAARSSA